MKTIKNLLLVLFISVISVAATEYKQAPIIPDKTVIIKNPSAGDLKTFFSSSTSLNFWVFKPGNATELPKLMKTVKAQKDVKSFETGSVNGDYQEFNLETKTAKDKQWYQALFKKAGFTHIMINNEAITPIDKI